ncbi:aldehyde-activating protein [Photobacterium jeanii]|uniref:Aldehyde-activating protein n=1 Tax=Photobacterium jeanii TaxID=858640 RepID=A0A178K6X7_9GAMM|nr:GFA family protein [Photobacterium jeanii]OAN13099.1 aldehyde-activating protein [Photobacterium jeanii]PST89249.1 GFA family protein [Photobacterium jeanii]
MYHGSCLCGAVKLSVDAKLSPVELCHCTKCRKFSGHIGATTEVPLLSVKIEGEDAITWFASSSKARRGFCSKCGTSLFFDPIDKQKHQWIGIYMGVFEQPTHVELAQHIFVAEKGDYYEIQDALPKNEY